MTTEKIELEWFTLKAGEIIQTVEDIRKEIVGKVGALEGVAEFIEHKVKRGVPIEHIQSNVDMMRECVSELETATKKLDDVTTKAEEIHAEVRRLKGKTILPFP